MPEVLVYTTERCSFCDRVRRLLDRKGVPYREVEVPRDDLDARRRLLELTGRFTLPQVVVDGRPLGGWDDLRRLEETGALERELSLTA